MKITDNLYFAPGIRFCDVDLSGQKLPDQFDARIRGFYIAPAMALSASGYGFASGLLLVSCIDALARLQYDSGVGERFRTWVGRLPSFVNIDLARRLYEEFRNGLVHEARIKKGGCFSLEQSDTVHMTSDTISVNPARLAEEVSAALEDYVLMLKREPDACRSLAARIRNEFKYELAHSRDA